MEKASLKEFIYATLLNWFNSSNTIESLSNRRKSLDEMGIKLSNILANTPNKILSFEKSEENLKQIICNYDTQKYENRKVFDSITKHHKRLLNEVWEDAVEDSVALQAYADGNIIFIYKQII